MAGTWAVAHSNISVDSVVDVRGGGRLVEFQSVCDHLRDGGRKRGNRMSWDMERELTSTAGMTSKYSLILAIRPAV